MSDASYTIAEQPLPHDTTALLLTDFADLYRQEVTAAEDVHRTLPFFGTALGIVVGALAYAASRLPKWPEITPGSGHVAFIAAAGLLGLAVVEAGCILFWIARATARRDFQRIFWEPDPRGRVADLQTQLDRHSTPDDLQDQDLAAAIRHLKLQSYLTVTPANREMNQRRYDFRAWASLHLVRGLIWALGATTDIFAADKLGILPKVLP